MPPDPVVLCYVSGHGFGHAARVCEVLRALRARRPDVVCVIRSPLDRWFFDFNLGAACIHGHARLDVGVIQADSLSVDLEATQRAYAAIDADSEQVIAAELRAVAPHRPAVVFADIPALAFDIARRLEVPGIAMANFSWDWIYADYAQALSGFAPLAGALRAAYGRATLLLRLPLHGDLSAFPRIRDVPLVARRAGRGRAAVRTALGLPRDDRLVLISFGGLGLRLQRMPQLPGVTFVMTGGAAIDELPPSGWRAVTHEAMSSAGVRYEDLVGACDVVMTKPGYGIVADCIANGTPMLYTERGRFAEYDCLVSGIEAHLPNAFISASDLQAGRWSVPLDRLFAHARRAPAIPIDGAEVAAEVLLSFIDR